MGTRVISKNLELTMEMVSQISQSGRQLQKVNKGIADSVEQMKQSGVSTNKDIEEVTASFRALREEIELLNKEMRVFKTAQNGLGPDSRG